MMMQCRSHSWKDTYLADGRKADHGHACVPGLEHLEALALHAQRHNVTGAIVINIRINQLNTSRALPPEDLDPSISSARYRASLALRSPRWYSVAGVRRNQLVIDLLEVLLDDQNTTALRGTFVLLCARHLGLNLLDLF